MYLQTNTESERFLVHFFTLILELLLNVELKENTVDDLSDVAVLSVALLAAFLFEHFK